MLSPLYPSLYVPYLFKYTTPPYPQPATGEDLITLMQGFRRGVGGLSFECTRVVTIIIEEWGPRPFVKRSHAKAMPLLWSNRFPAGPWQHSVFLAPQHCCDEEEEFFHCSLSGKNGWDGFSGLRG
ncbi:hypothetical protein CDAR_580541 [Caerostris darwini]|uniref:Uncharacterized protein n=1 Tax=Caerostris darwini TaxID=1538125 RepID=A0AAV4R7A4_9ARAC|nr:hypothetical protein CDAR_580541 [Caerostris darwini]